MVFVGFSFDGFWKVFDGFLGFAPFVFVGGLYSINMLTVDSDSAQESNYMHTNIKVVYKRSKFQSIKNHPYCLRFSCVHCSHCKWCIGNIFCTIIWFKVGSVTLFQKQQYNLYPNQQLTLKSSVSLEKKKKKKTFLGLGVMFSVKPTGAKKVFFAVGKNH